MSFQSWQETLVTSQVDGTALTNTAATPTSIIPASAKYTLPANFFAIGKMLRVTSRGRISCVVTTPGTLTLDVRLGAVIAYTTQAVAMNTTAKTNVAYEFEVVLTCRAIGGTTTANLMGMGSITSEAMVGASAGAALTIMCPASAPAVGTGFDSTAALTIDHFATFSVATATTSIQTHEYAVEALN